MVAFVERACSDLTASAQAEALREVIINLVHPASIKLFVCQLRPDTRNCQAGGEIIIPSCCVQS